MTNELKLKACVECGGIASLESASDGNGNNIYQVSCSKNDCYNCGDSSYSMTEAVESWNTRAEQPMGDALTTDNAIRRAFATPSPAADNRLDAFEQQLRARGLDAASEKAMIEDCKLDEAIAAAEKEIENISKCLSNGDRTCAQYICIRDIKNLIEAASRPEPECVTLSKADVKRVRKVLKHGLKCRMNNSIETENAIEEALRILEGKNDE